MLATRTVAWQPLATILELRPEARTPAFALLWRVQALQELMMSAARAEGGS